MSFPEGKSKVDTIAATAGNVVDTYTVPALKKNQLLCVRINITTDGTVVNRYVIVQITDGTNLLYQNTSDAIPASQTENKYFIAGLDSTGATYNGLPAKNLLPAGYTVVVTIVGGVAGDSYEGFTWLREVDEP